MTIDELVIALGLKTDGVKKGAKEAENTISGMTSAITAKLGLLSAAAAAAFSVFARFGEYVSQADSMGKLANALDVDIEKMHAWGEAAARAGGSVEGFQGSLQSLTAQLARQATVGTSRAAKMLEGVGIDAGEIGRQRQAFDVMMDLAEKAETMGKQEFFGLGRSLGLDQGTIMLLQQGRTALKDAIQAQKEFGVYTKEDAKLTADWNDRVADFGQVMKSFSAIIFRMILPAMTKFVEWINKGVAFLRKHERFVQAFFIGLATVITAILIPALVKLGIAWLSNPMVLTIAAVVAALAALALIVEDLVLWAEGGESAFADFWEAIFGSPEEAQRTWEEIKTTAEETVNKIIEVWSKLKESINNFIDMIKSAFESFFGWIGEKFDWLGNKISSVLNGAAAKGSAITAGAGASMDTSGFEPESNGGIINSPTRALVGEAGSEAIIPLGVGKRNRGLELLSKIAGNFIDVSAAQALPMGGAASVTNNTDTRVSVGTVNISAADGTDAGNQFMDSIESRASAWTAAANAAY